MKDMLGRGEAVSAEEALRRLAVLPLKTPPAEEKEIEDACGRVLAENIVSPEDVPAFPRSTMDGYAVRASDTFGCSDTVPAYLKVTGEIRVDDSPRMTVGTGEAVSIPTGGMLPSGADAVVMLEHVQTTGRDMIEVMRPVAPGENVVQAGEDMKEGEKLLGAGHVLRPQDIGALAGVGITMVKVFKRPTVGIISTGDEIVPPDQPLRAGQVRDINSYNLAGLIAEMGGIPRKYGIFPDIYEDLRAVMSDAVNECDMVLISGGSSVGTRDMTAGIIEEMEKGGVLFHGVAVRPGKPLIGGFVRSRPVFGLPGHPAAVTVSFLNFVAPVLKKIAGVGTEYRPEIPCTVEAVLAKNISSAPGREDYIRVALIERDGELYAEPILGKSGLINTLVRADGIVVIPAHAQGAGKGEKVRVRVFRRW